MNTHPSEAQLNELIDGVLQPDELARVEAHVANCLPCAATIRRIESLIERTRALPRDIDPPAEAWEAVRAAVRSPGARERAPARPRVRWSQLAAAAALIVATSGITVWVLRGDPGRAVPSSNQSATPAMLAAFAPVEARYVLAADVLRESLDERRTTLDPETIAAVERSLATIDTAIAEARAALARDPGNGTISRLLASSYEQKVALLRRASELTPRS
jgi:predicted anti-sigma-YlaC factor YlaD